MAMRKSRVWLMAVAVVLVGSTVVIGLSYSPISAILSGSGPNVSNPTLNGPFWLQPIPPSVIAGEAVSASFTVGNPYPFSLINIWLIMNFTGGGVTSACVTSGNCLSGSVTVPGSGTVPFAFCSSCGSTTVSGNPQFVLFADVPALQSGISTMSLTLVFQHAGAFNEQVFFALNSPYP